MWAPPSRSRLSLGRWRTNNTACRSPLCISVPTCYGSLIQALPCAQTLEAEKKLLAAELDRASGRYDECFQERCSLAAQLEAARNIHASQLEEAAREKARLSAELERTQGECQQAQRKLSDAQEMVAQSVQAVSFAHRAADER